MPTYLELADDLAGRLDTTAGRVPSEHELSATHRVSRPTARAALQELERRFLVRRVRGAGTFVNRRIDYVISPDHPPSVTETLRRVGIEPHIQVRSISVGRAADAAKELGIAPDEIVTVIRRRIVVEQRVVACATATVRADVAPALADEIGEDSSLYRVLRDRYGTQLRRRSSRASLAIPSARIAAELALDGRPPTWLIESVSERSTDRVAVESTRSWMRSDVVNVVFEVGAR